MLPDSALDQRTILGLRGKLKQIYYLTPLCLTEETITGHFRCHMSFFLTIKRDPENSVSVHGHKDGSFAESKFKRRMFWCWACILFSDLATSEQNPQDSRNSIRVSQVGAGHLVRNCNLWLPRAFSEGFPPPVCVAGIFSIPVKALRFYICKLREEWDS